MPLFFRPFAGRETERPAVRQKGSGNIHTGVDIAGLSHEQLVVRVATERDRAAFRILFDHYAPRLKSYLVTLGLGDERAEDLAQETLVTVWQKAEQFQPDKARLSTWMFRIARNKFIDQTRRQKYPEVDADDHLQHLVSDDKADTGAIEGQMADRVATAMARLKENQRQVIELSFFEELSHTEIAERLSLPLGTVKSRIRIAFEALRNELGEFK
ncbi:MAG: sigma-70 family RNA polymerase sigma factor [Alphaproteobacteria bacterium]|nr:MAG: sigma-70 family RNA polymerase sigma factor [Alphaproteobacteria bacterium]